MTETQTPAGWYYMQGDPPNTQRWWDGVQWTGEPQAQQVVQPVAAQVAAPAAEPAAAVGSQLAADLASYWDNMEEKVDPAAQFSDPSAWDQDPGEGADGDTSHLTPATTTIEGGASENVSPLAWMFLPYKHFANFKGRSCRAEFWWFALMNVVVSWGLLFAGAVLGIKTVENPGLGEPPSEVTPIGMALFGAMLIFSLISMIPYWAVYVRRLHDTGRSGWAILLGLIPFIGGIWLLIITLTPGNSGWNKYGDEHIRPV